MTSKVRLPFGLRVRNVVTPSDLATSPNETITQAVSDALSAVARPATLAQTFPESAAGLVTFSITAAGWYCIALSDNAQFADYRTSFSAHLALTNGANEGSLQISASNTSAGTQGTLVLVSGAPGIPVTGLRIRKDGANHTALDAYINWTTGTLDFSVIVSSVSGAWNGASAEAASSAASGTVVSTLNLDPAATGTCQALSGSTDVNGQYHLDLSDGTIYTGAQQLNLDQVQDGTNRAGVLVTELTGTPGAHTVKQLNDQAGNIRTAQQIAEVLRTDGSIQSFANINGRSEGIGTTVTHLTSTGLLDTADSVNADGSTYARIKGTALTSGEVDLSLSGVISKTLRYVTDGNLVTSVGTGDGSTTSFAEPSNWTDLSSVYVDDWQGNQLQYSTPRTNYCGYSQDGTHWGAGTGVTITANNATGPDSSSSSASTIAYDGTGGAGAYRFYNAHNASPITSGNPCATVVWMKATVGTPTLLLSVNGQGTSLSCPLTSSWQRFELDQNYASTNKTLQINANAGDNSTWTIEVSFWQFEDAAVAGSYIPTTTAAVTQTDYSISGSDIVFAVAPANSAAITSENPRNAVGSVDSNTRALIDFTQSGHVSKILDNIADGSTYARVKGTELSSGLVQQLNDGTHTRTITQARAAILSTADANGNQVGPVSTSGATDDAGLGNSASWATVTGQPTTRAGYGIKDAQGTLPTTSGTKHIWASDSGGTIYETAIYGGEINCFGESPQSAVTLSGTVGTYTYIGDIVDLGNPGVPVGLLMFFRAGAEFSSITATTEIFGEFEYSTNGGSTWTTAGGNYAESSLSGTFIFPYVDFAFVNIPSAPSGHIQIRYKATRQTGTTGACYMTSSSKFGILLPNASGVVSGGTLSVSVPATAAASCTAINPATTCAATASITALPSGGLLPLSYSWSRTGGTGSGTITSGATAQTCTVSDTQTGTSAGAAFTDTYECVVTDSTTPTAQTANASCTVTSTYYAGYAAISPSISVVSGACSTGTSAWTCTAAGTFSVSATGGNGNYTYSNSVYSHDLGFSTNPTIASGATASSGTYSGAATTSIIPGTKLKVTLQTSVNDTHGTGAQTATGYAYLTFKYTS